MRKKLCWVFLATLVIAAPASAQRQVETAFEVGLGYASPLVNSSFGTGGIQDMASLIIQSDNYFFETGIGLTFGGNTVFGWLVRGAARPFMIGNVLIHTGVEFSLHTNSTVNSSGEPGTMTGLGFLFGASHQISDRINAEVHIYPLAFTFGGPDTSTSIGGAKFGAHFLF